MESSHEIVLDKLNSIENDIIDINSLGLESLPESNKWKSVKTLICHNNKLKKLPHNLFNLVVLICSDNVLEYLPVMPKLLQLSCGYNKLKEIPSLESVKLLYCNNNNISHIGELPNIQVIYCHNNNLEVMPRVKFLIYGSYANNKLVYKFNNIRFYNYLWKIVDYILVKIYFTRWKKLAREKAYNRKKYIHLELQYSPNLPFYKETDEYQHWITLGKK